MLKYFLKKL